MRLALVLVGMLIGAWQTPAAAQGEPEPSAPPPAPAASVAPPPQVLPLSLTEAIALGIENNTDVQIVRYEPPIAEYQHDAAWGAYDPALFGDYTYQSTNLPVASAFFPGQFIERSSLGDVGFAGLVPLLGWNYQLAYSGDSIQTNSRIQTLATTYTSNLTASLNAPLLRGAWWGGAWTQVKQTGIASEIAMDQFRQNLMDLVGGPPGVPLETNPSIEAGYWTLAARKQELEVANKSLETARALLRQAEAQYDVGVVSRVEVTEAEAGVADREFRQITADNLYRRAQDDLVDRVYGPRLTPSSQIAIEPTDRPENYVTFALDPEASAARALESRPELAIARQRVELSEIALKFARNSRLPQLDLVGSYGTHGLAGNDPNCPFSQIDPITGDCLVVPTQPANIGREYTDTHDFYFDGNDNRVWTAGAVASIPIPNTAGRANVAASELERRRALTQLRRVEQDIVKDVRDAVRNLASALQGVQAAERAVAASEEQLRAERIRLEHGESTPFDVLLREENLVTAESQRIAALRIYHGSVTALDRAQGTLLEDRSIVLEDALPLR
jgi:outer membrane protein TolC